MRNPVNQAQVVNWFGVGAAEEAEKVEIGVNLICKGRGAV